MFKKFNKLTNQAKEDPFRFNGNPINIYLIIKQLTHDSDLIRNHLTPPNSNNTWNLDGKNS